MTHKIDFEHEFQYRELADNIFAPALDVTIFGPHGQDDLLAIVDTGAKFCLFDGRRAESIGLELLAGRQQRLGGLAGGVLTARMHQVRLEILGPRSRATWRLANNP